MRSADVSARPSILLGLIAFAIDRGHKFVQVSLDCIEIGASRCVADTFPSVPLHPTGWRGGEGVAVTPFLDYVLVWNTGISYGLLADMPVIALGALMAFAILALGLWWWRTDAPLVRAGLALCIGGALSNALDRLLFGAVADFFYLHWDSFSFYIFNLADAAITLGVILLVLDLFGAGRLRPAKV